MTGADRGLWLKRQPWAIWPIAIAVGLATFGLGYAGYHSNFLAVDSSCATSCVPLTHSSASTGLLAGLIFAAAVGGYLFVRACLARQFGLLLSMLVGAAATQTAARAVKDSVRRPRPPHPLLHAGGLSFPSSTAALSIGFAALALVLYRRGAFRRPTIGVSLGLSISVGTGVGCVLTRVHYVSDVVAGWGLGIAVFGLVLAVWATVEKAVPSR